MGNLYELIAVMALCFFMTTMFMTWSGNTGNEGGATWYSKSVASLVIIVILIVAAGDTAMSFLAKASLASIFAAYLFAKRAK